jgi:SPIRAL1-like protein
MLPVPCPPPRPATIPHPPPHFTRTLPFPPSPLQHNALNAAKNEANGHGKAGPGNNFARPEGQNVGNFLGDRPSTKVHTAPGGASQIIFG